MSAAPSIILSPIANPTAYDVVTIGGITSPGLCFLTGFKRVQAMDKKVGKGTVGVTNTMVAKPPVTGHIKFLLWNDGGGLVRGTSNANQFLAMSLFLQQLKYDPAKQNITAVDVYHPSLAAIDAVAFVCEEIGALEIEGEPGMGLYALTIKLSEYQPPPKVAAVSTPSSATGNSSGGPGAQTDPVADAQQAQIAQLLQKASQP